MRIFLTAARPGPVLGVKSPSAKRDQKIMVPKQASGDDIGRHEQAVSSLPGLLKPLNFLGYLLTIV